MKARVKAAEPAAIPVDPEILASFDKAQEFQVTITEAGRSTTRTVTDTLEGVMQRGNRYLQENIHREYDRQKQDWLRRHPTASDHAYEAECRRIAKSLGL